MSVLNRRQQNSQTSGREETIFRGRAVGRGAVVGRVVCFYGNRKQFYRLNLTDSQVEPEIRRFRLALRCAKKRLKDLSSAKEASRARAQIFDTHLLILEDKSLIAKIETVVGEQKVNAEWAVDLVTDNYINAYKQIADEHLRERYIDLQDVAENLLEALGKRENMPLSLGQNAVIVAKEIKPSTLIELAQSDVKAIVAESGGWTSHTFILARELNLPAVTGIKGILRRVETGDEIVVDGFGGRVILNPKAATAREYRTSAAQFQQNQAANFNFAKDKLQTLDGREITIRANLDIPNGYALAEKFGAKGIGLFRSEFLFNQHRGFPTEAEQIAAYRKIADLAGENVVKVRTFDLNLEEIADVNETREKNPALGLRGVRFGLAHEKHFRTQIRALLQASEGKNLHIVLPMISDVSEIRRTKEILNEERKKLAKKRISCGTPQIGAMIEVPSAVVMIEEIASEVDFLNLGTNDLVQYLLAVDREGEAVADWFRTLHPAVLRAVERVIKAAEKCGKPLVVCGEMAGSPAYAPVLIGFGATELSMNAASIPRVRRVIENIAFEEAAAFVKTLESCRTAGEAEEVVRAGLTRTWAHLFTSDVFPRDQRKPFK